MIKLLTSEKIDYHLIKLNLIMMHHQPVSIIYDDLLTNTRSYRLDWIGSTLEKSSE